uniref:Pulmonary surfactant-associated protein B n=1 Tax=Clastoptera arizonana TaxID=38151 RepID=A0A1B6E2D6_9HEMI
MFIEMCGKMGSFSDGCAAIMITYFNDLYSNLNTRLKPNETCHIAGVCSPKYHIHADKVDLFSKATKNDDLPCELCEQLVQHLADILVSNTTEEEFQQVLLGICGQTKSFKNECVNIVKEYYPIIYEFLTKELDGKVICRQIGICNKTSLINGKFDVPLYPLIPVNMESQIELLNDGNINQKPKLHHVSLVKDEISIHSGSPALNVEIMQLPAERLTPLSMLPKNKEECEFCEYFLHYLQVEITDPMTEKQLKQLIERGCDKLPNSVSSQCKDFIETYGQAFVALLAQKIDPSQVCPSIGVCPGLTEKSLINEKDKPTCPLCLMVMETLTDELKDNKTEDNIRKTLDDICNLLPKTVTKDCVQLVDTYFEEVIDMVIAEFTPLEVCSYMKMCSAPKDVIGGDINTNEIPDTLDDEKKDNNQCVLCEFIMSQLEKELQDKKTEEEIKNAVLKICQVLPATVRPQCSKFVEKYADLIIELLAASVDPKGLCTAMKLCPTPDVDILLKGDQIKKGINKCIVCESIMGALQGILEDENIELSLNEKLILSCQQLPKKNEFHVSRYNTSISPTDRENLIFYSSRSFSLSQTSFMRTFAKGCTIRKQKMYLGPRILVPRH